MDKKGLGIVALLLVITGFGVITVTSVADHNSSVQHNEPTTATIISVDIDERLNDGDREYRPAIRYRYTVDGETYTSDNVYPGQFVRWHGSESTAASVVERYTAGSDTTASGDPVTIYYNPDDPGEAYLHNPGWPSGWYIAVALNSAVFAGGLYFIWRGFKRWRQRTLIRDTPTERAQSLSIGPSEVSGTAVPATHGSLTAPFSDEECVVAQYEVEEYDTSGDNNSWKSIDEGVLWRPFYVDDGTGQVLVRPHDEATYDLDPSDWSETYVDSSRRGPEPVQQFVEYMGLGYPSDASGQSNDRKYRQNLVRTGESAYVFGTVQPRDRENVPDDAANADRLVVQKITDDSMREPMFLISDDSETGLIDRRRWALWRLPVGGFFLVVGFSLLLLIFGPMVGVEIPRVFDGFIESVS